MNYFGNPLHTRMLEPQNLTYTQASTQPARETSGQLSAHPCHTWGQPLLAV